jgi:hypothetical protein
LDGAGQRSAILFRNLHVRRVFIAAVAAGLGVGLPYFLDRWDMFGSTLAAVGICICAPLLPGVYAAVPVFETVGVDFFDSSADLDATGTILMVGINFITWFVASLLAADVVSFFLRIKRTVASRDA